MYTDTNWPRGARFADVKRRVFLGAVGSVGSLGALTYATRPPATTLEVRFWLTDAAAAYGVEDRLEPYLEAALGLDLWTLDLSYGGVVATSTESGADVTRRGEWPRAVAAGAVRRQGVDPAADVNLLITDGQMRRAPTGYGVPHVASVGGARYLGELERTDDVPEVVPYERPYWSLQVLVHEVGHALGLEHAHGRAYRSDGAVVVTPMLSSYAWDPEYDVDARRNSCESLSLPLEDPDDVDLQLTFSSCARDELEAYAGGYTP